MKITTIAAVATLVLASTSFGAMTLTVDKDKVDPGVFDLTFHYTCGADSLVGVSLFVQPDKSDNVELIGFLPFNEGGPGLSAFNPAGTVLQKNQKRTLPSFDEYGMLLNDGGDAVKLMKEDGSLGKDIGAQPDKTAFIPLNNVDEDYATATFRAAGEGQLIIQGTWTVKNMQTGEYEGGGAFGPMTVTITPEPASMTLLAAAAAFFARRRRA